MGAPEMAGCGARGLTLVGASPLTRVGAGGLTLVGAGLAVARRCEARFRLRQGYGGQVARVQECRLTWVTRLVAMANGWRGEGHPRSPRRRLLCDPFLRA